MNALIDNDVVLKCSCYGLAEELLTLAGSSTSLIGVLGAARFVVSRRLTKMSLQGGAAQAQADLELLLARSLALEPTEAELALAAEFELAAQYAAVFLDSGESQLCAMLISRAVPTLLTGDKRAIRALETLLDTDSRLVALAGKVECLEQLILSAMNCTGTERIRTAICAQPAVDKSLTICFSCASGVASEQSYNDGLKSYIGDLRAAAARILAP